MNSGIASSGAFSYSNVAIAPTKRTGDVRRYIVRMETSVPLSVNDVARQVQNTLDDPRGWISTQSAAGVSFALVSDPRQAQFVLTLASGATVSAQCSDATFGLWSCDDGVHLALNYDRWQYAAPGYLNGSQADLVGYRAFLVNHAVGRYLGFGVSGCPGAGRKAPVMMRQDRGLAGCVANPWPTLTN